jgi:hypothetical protein
VEIKFDLYLGDGYLRASLASDSLASYRRKNLENLARSFIFLEFGTGQLTSFSFHPKY